MELDVFNISCMAQNHLYTPEACTLWSISSDYDKTAVSSSTQVQNCSQKKKPESTINQSILGQNW